MDNDTKNIFIVYVIVPLVIAVVALLQLLKSKGLISSWSPLGVVAKLWKRFSINGLIAGTSQNQLPDSQYDSRIISFYTPGHTISLATSGKLEDMPYYTYTAMPKEGNDGYVGSSAAINVLNLPFNTDSHVIGLSKEHKIDRIKFENFVRTDKMEKVVLEGDFSDYFDLYAPRDQQINVREVLHPRSMEYVVDFCRTHFWEINQSMLYFVASTDDKSGGNIFEEGQNFANYIKPALLPGYSGAAPINHEVPYTEELNKPTLPCPICNKPMLTNKSWRSCTDGHGILIGENELEGFHDQLINIPADATKAVTHPPLTCPGCQSHMKEIDYRYSGINIEVCTNCTFRWIDADKISKIFSGKSLNKISNSDS